MVTGSKWEMAAATAAKVFWAGAAFNRQLSARWGQSIQVRVCCAHSAGMKKPSARGVEMGMTGIFFLPQPPSNDMTWSW